MVFVQLALIETDISIYVGQVTRLDFRLRYGLYVVWRSSLRCSSTKFCLSIF